tara:strand:- start:203 stop:427 length:225 start_codon:yes stop_codon:yes gene_type:complete
MNDHGSYAQPGDFVQFITVLGEPQEIYGVVIEVLKPPSIHKKRRYVRVAWQDSSMHGAVSVRASCLKIIKRLDK